MDSWSGGLANATQNRLNVSENSRRFGSGYLETKPSWLLVFRTPLVTITAVEEFVHVGGGANWWWAGKLASCLTTRLWWGLETTDGLLQRQVLLSQHTETFLQYTRLLHLLLQLHSPYLHDTAEYNKINRPQSTAPSHSYVTLGLGAHLCRRWADGEL